MAEFTKEQVTTAFLSKLYESLTARPDIDADALPDDRFIAWCQPGLPFEPEDFMFALKGIGRSAGSAAATGEEDGDAAATLDREGEELRQRILRASDWARLTNFIPNPSGIYDDEQQKKMFDTTAFTQDGSSMASLYETVLRHSEVAYSELSEDVEARMTRFRGLLSQTIEEEDLFSGKTKTRVVDSPLVVAYNTYMSEYIDASLEYNTKRLNALNSNDSLAVQDWALNASNYRRRVKAAYSKWVSLGYKNDVEKIGAYIDQVTMRDLTLMKADLLDKLDKSRISDPTSGEEFLWTSLIPAGLPFSKGWTTYNFSQSEVRSYSKSQNNAWSAKAKLPLGSWFGASASGSGSTKKIEREYDTSNFKMSFEVAQGMISRCWFSPEFLFSNAWRFPEDLANLTNFGEALSDGKTPPKGAMIAYPTTAIFVRNVKVSFDELKSESSDLTKQLKTGGGMHIGPFNLGGASYERGSTEREFKREVTEEGLEIPGMQLIGFKCKLLPQLPNPSDEVEKWA